MRASGARTWRDLTADEWLFNREISRGDYLNALGYADAVLRMHSDLQTKFFPALAVFTTNPQAFKALTDFLATSPPWRTWFLAQLSARLANQGRLVQLYRTLSQSRNPPTKNELQPYLERLIKDADFEQAYQTWYTTLPPEQQADKNHPFNRDFKFPLDGLPFNWELESISGADSKVVPIEGSGKPALRVQFSGARVHFANVKQLMLLPPGSYTFSGRVKTEALRTSRGLWWHIFCANKPTTSLAHTDLVVGTLPWTDFSARFEVPASDCKAQWLQLELPARIDPELKIEGQVWYQYLRITPTPPLDQ